MRAGIEVGFNKEAFICAPLPTPTDEGGLRYYPSASRIDNGYVFVWIEHDPLRDRDQLLVGSAAKPPVIVTASQALLSPSITRLSDELLAVLWIDGSSFTAHGVTFDAKLNRAGELVQLSTAGHRASHLVARPSGSGIWCAWEEWDERARSRIAIRNWSQDGLTSVAQLSEATTNAYFPSICESSGLLYCAWTSPNRQSDGYDVVLGEFKIEENFAGKTYQLNRPTQGNFHLYPNLLTDEKGMAWIAWSGSSEEEHYDLTDLPGNSDFAYLQTESYRRKRNLWWKSFRPFVARIDSGNVDLALAFPGKDNWDGQVDALGYCHYPTLVPSGGAVPGLVGRRLTGNLLFEVVGTVFTEGGWQSPTMLMGGSAQTGRNGPISICHAGNPYFSLTSQVHAVKDDDVFRWRPPLDSTITAIEVSVVAGNGAPANSPFTTLAVDKWVPRQPVAADRKKSAGRPFFGNLHCHTEYSGCRRETQQSLDLNYRWALDLMHQDFHVITDHAEHLSSYDWHSTKTTSRFYDFPETFVSLLAYEWTVNDFGDSAHSGHCNVLLRDLESPCYGSDEPETNTLPRLWGKLDPAVAITVPHHTATFPYLRDWDLHDPDLERLVEVHQDRRGNYEYYGCPGEYGVAAPTQVREKNFDGGYVADALDRGYLLGLCSGGDHMGVSMTGIWAPRLDRESVFQALRDRSCFGVSGAKVELRLTATTGGSNKPVEMGEVVSVSADQVTSLRFEATAAIGIVRLALISNGEEIHSKEFDAVNSANVELPSSFQVELPYVYGRAELTDGELAWSSPIWFLKGSSAATV